MSFRITLSPIAARTQDTPPSVEGDRLHYRDNVYDLSALPEGAEVPTSRPFVGPISKQNGIIQLELEYHYDDRKAEPDQPPDPAAYTFEVTDGPVPDPIVYKEAT